MRLLLFVFAVLLLLAGFAFLSGVVSAGGINVVSVALAGLACFVFYAALRFLRLVR